jgi:long-chain fatty acid transport protein
LGAIIAAGTTAVAFHGTAWATNGYFQHGYGTASKGMAGIGVALPQDTQSVIANPAGVATLGDRVDIGIGFFMPDRDVTATGGGTVTNGVYASENELFLIPDFGVNYKFTPDTALAITLTGNGGMNTEYKTNPFATFTAATSSTPAGVDLAQTALGVTLAHRIGNHSLGISPTLAVQRIKAYGLQAFTGVSKYSNHVTDQGYDYSGGGGVRIGYMGTFFDDLTVGVSYQSRMWMSKFTKYKGLFANEGEFDVPPVVGAGLAYRVPSTKVTLGFDWQWIQYRQVEAVSNDGVMSLNSLANAGERRLGGNDHAPGFGWNDVHVFKLGVSWQALERLNLRAGVSHNTGVYSDHDMLFNILAPATVRTHASVGATYDFDANHSLSLAYTRGFSNSIDGTHVSNGAGTLDHRMDQHDVMVGYAFRW